MDKLYREFECYYCPEVFLLERNRTTHEKTHFSQRKKPKNKEINLFKCSYCSKVFGSKYLLGKHEQTIHTHTFTCDSCQVSFTNKKDFQVHKMSHEHLYKFKCQDCQVTFYWKAHLEQHKLTHHNKSSDFKCNECSATFSHKGFLEKHKLKHNLKRNLNHSKSWHRRMRFLQVASQ